jgi:transcriptional regulator with XRE-family HTH domain
MMNELGVRLREARIRHGWTLDGLSERCGLSPSFLSQVERGLSTLSIVSLSAICTALDLPIETLFSSSAPLDQRAPRVTTADRQLLIRIGDSPVSYRYLSGQLPALPIAELLIAEFPAGCDQRDSAHEGQEMGYVLEGVLELRVGEEEYRMSVGDSYRIDASEPHDYRTSADLGARVLMAVTQRFIEVPREDESGKGSRVSNEV